MFSKDLTGNTAKRAFDPNERRHLGNYVYALRDPRDNKIFYVGQGAGNRLFDHFNEAEAALGHTTSTSSKIIRILDIWNNDENVDWSIIAHSLDQGQSNVVESAVIDALGFSQNGPCLNIVRGPHSSMLDQDEIAAFAAEPIGPNRPFNKVFIFPIQRGLADGRNVYEATRCCWRLNINLCEIQEETIAVGINNGISVGSYSLENWAQIENGRYQFSGNDFEEFFNKNWARIIAAAIGYWQRGNFLVVQFDGEGHFRIIRGLADAVWTDL